MKVRSTKVIPQWILDKFFLQEVCQLPKDQQDGLAKAKLLSAKGCDSIVYTEDARDTRQTDLDFGESLADISQQQSDLEVYDEISSSS